MLKKVLSCSVLLAGLALSGAASANEDAEALAKQHICTACHGIDQKIVGPAYTDVAAKYADKENALELVKASIKAGGSGKWGQAAMPPQAQLSDEQLTILAEWILSQKK
ncbi:cytochrome C [Pseudidiomarina sediminum]|uniref:Cytochrome c-551 n=1 Tax=Pseudidiomarina sediminum TaxID=431675 RepID=A0A432Z8Z6_9GAMM|nr:c-type cytochrome [Pseudidiomarina sediminum]MBY6063562.1 c-type cytochrome [Pseudidiomarina sediminum]RUO74387.1 cytochrome C [Pseudidiomarina sediminum]